MLSFWAWIADAALAILLIGTLIMSVRLDRALRVVRRDRAVFETLINNLGSATSSVKTGIQALRSEADRAAEQIERRTEDADKMATDLSFLIEAADRAGSKLEQQLRAMPDGEHEAPETTVRPPSTGTLRRHRTARSAPLRSSAPEPVSVKTTEPEPIADGLRELAGITTRGRPRVPSGILRAREINAAAARQGPESKPNEAMIKLVG